MLVTERYVLPKKIREEKRSNVEFGFNGFGAATYYRTYSREGERGQEHWTDTCVRVVEGVFSIRKDWYKKLGLRFVDYEWDALAGDMLDYIIQMKFLPPGRGLWAMGTEYVYQRGAMALNNCGGTEIGKEWIRDIGWSMDAMMCGVGVGYRLLLDHTVVMPKELKGHLTFFVPDSKEGWCESIETFLREYQDGFLVKFDYSGIRDRGDPIVGFGGVCPGADPLILCHQRLKQYCEDFAQGKVSQTRFLADVINAVGMCVVSGNVRRGAQILLGPAGTPEFRELKDYDKNPERAIIGGLSNNSVVLERDEDFLVLPEIAKAINKNGEPGILNLLNIQKYARIGVERHDRATITNPCGEIPLEDKELCNLVELFPTRCADLSEVLKATRLATFYAQSVSLLQTHREESNEVISRNRRIGVSIAGAADWLDELGAAVMTRNLRRLYNVVVDEADKWAAHGGVPKPVRYTCIKPGGTVPQLAGVSSGMSFPTFQFAVRRMRVAEGSKIDEVLRGSEIPWEMDVVTPGTVVYEFPINQGKTRKATEVSAWEQFALLSMLQREWADNMVSCTIYFNPETEGRQVEHMLGQFAPLVKSVSMLPHTAAGAYAQMPYEGISEAEYEKRRSVLRPIEWDKFGGGADKSLTTMYCDGDRCEIPMIEGAS